MMLSTDEKMTIKSLGQKRLKLFSEHDSISSEIELKLNELSDLVDKRNSLKDQMLKIDVETNKLLGI